jgi:hypothetical protein
LIGSPFERASTNDRWYAPLARNDSESFWKYHKVCGIPEEAKRICFFSFLPNIFLVVSFPTKI